MTAVENVIPLDLKTIAAIPAGAAIVDVQFVATGLLRPDIVGQDEVTVLNAAIRAQQANRPTGRAAGSTAFITDRVWVIKGHGSRMEVPVTCTVYGTVDDALTRYSELTDGAELLPLDPKPYYVDEDATRYSVERIRESRADDGVLWNLARFLPRQQFEQNEAVYRMLSA